MTKQKEINIDEFLLKGEASGLDAPSGRSSYDFIGIETPLSPKSNINFENFAYFINFLVESRLQGYIYPQLNNLYSFMDDQDKINNKILDRLDKIEKKLDLLVKGFNPLTDDEINKISRENAINLRKAFGLPEIKETKKTSKELLDTLDGLFSDCIDDSVDFCELSQSRY